MAGHQMQLEDWLDDLCVRFIINLPQEDLSSVARICFQVEEAQWFYEDFIRPLDPTLPSMTLRTFSLRIFQHCPLLASFSVENHIKAFEEFLQYKTRVPVRGAIMLNHDMDSVVLVKGWKKGANWSFPRGKINKDEDDLDCAVREVYEETGLDLQEAGLVPTEGKPKYIEIPMREQHLRLYVFRDVPMDTNFQPRTRKEISKIQWYKLSELPTLRKKGPQSSNQHYDSGPGANANKFYMVAPFLVPLKKWIVSQKKMGEKRVLSSGSQTLAVNQHLAIEEMPTEDEGWASYGQANITAIESLDGATREVHRLLHLQPPNQDVPPPATVSENKASALLSLLQPASSTNAARGVSHSVVPHPRTPLDHMVTEAGQPRNPHHHTNTVPHGQPALNQPPPSFVLPMNQGPTGWSQFQNQSNSQPEVMLSTGQTAQGGHSYGVHAAAKHVNIGYSQPFPPQAQGQVLNIFRGGQGLANYAAGTASDFQMDGPQAVYGHTDHTPQVHMLPNTQRQNSLSGQSLALLSVLKQEPAAHLAEQPKDIPPSQPNSKSPYAQYASSYRQNAPQQIVPNSINNMMSRPPQPMSPMELAGSAVGPPATEQHRSALLGLFKKQGPEAEATAGQPTTEPTTVPAEHISEKGQAEQRLLAALHNVSSLSKTGSGPLEQNLLAERQKVGSGDKKPEASYSNNQSNLPLMDRLTIQNNLQQESTAPDQRATQKKAAAAATGLLQPTRILQRGQTLQQLDPAEKSASPASLYMQPFDLSGQHRHDYTNPSPSNLPLPSSLAASKPIGVPNYRADVSEGQRKQLLSLFGSSGAGAPSMKSDPSHAGSSISDAPRALMTSQVPTSADAQDAFRNAAPSRTSTSTPISQADQNFLLDYLQSVTNNARR